MRRMSIAKILTFTLLLFQTHFNVNNLRTDDKTNFSTNADDRHNDDNDVVYQVTINDIGEGDIATVSRTKRWTALLKARTPQREVPAARTDVILRLQDKTKLIYQDKTKRIHQDKTNNIHQDKTNNIHQDKTKKRDKSLPSSEMYRLPDEKWRFVSYSLPKVTPFLLSSSPSRTTLSLKDHFSPPHFLFRPRYRPNLGFFSSKTRDLDFVSPFGYPFKNLVRKRNFLLTSKPWYAIDITESNTDTHFQDLTRTTSNERILTRTFNSDIAGTEMCTILETTIDTDYEYEFLNDGNDAHERHEYLSTKELDTRETSAISHDATHNYELENIDREQEEIQEYDVERKFFSNIETNTTTTTRTTRTYPYPQWICYECGRNETKFGSSFCHNVFEIKPRKENNKMMSLRYRCNGNWSVVYGCFKRFLDVGHYNERGCRNWPPRRSGKTYASKRLRALERVLKNEKDACIFTPQASLVSFSRTVQLYVRFHVCVCRGPLCNSASSGSCVVTLFLVSLIIFYVK